MVCKLLPFSSVESRCADGTIGRAVRSSIGASGGIFSCEQPVGQEKRREERGARGGGAEAMLKGKRNLSLPFCVLCPFGGNRYMFSPSVSA